MSFSILRADFQGTPSPGPSPLSLLGGSPRENAAARLLPIPMSVTATLGQAICLPGSLLLQEAGSGSTDPTQFTREGRSPIAFRGAKGHYTTASQSLLQLLQAARGVRRANMPPEFADEAEGLFQQGEFRSEVQVEAEARVPEPGLCAPDRRYQSPIASVQSR